MSTISSTLARSPIGTCFDTRKSLKTVHGVVPALRPRFPSSDINEPSKFAMQGSWKTPVGEKEDETGMLPSAVQPGLTNVLGREVSDDNCRLSPFPVRILKGRPEPNSSRGANVQSLSNALENPPEPTLPV